MNAFQAWQLLLVTLAGWMNRHQQDVIEYVQEENRVLRTKLKGKRIRFTDDERRRLAVKGKVLGRSVLNRAVRHDILHFRARSTVIIASNCLGTRFDLAGFTFCSFRYGLHRG